MRDLVSLLDNSRCIKGEIIMHAMMQKKSIFRKLAKDSISEQHTPHASGTNELGATGRNPLAMAVRWHPSSKELDFSISHRGLMICIQLCIARYIEN